MQLNRRELLKSLAGVAAALSVGAPLAVKACECELRDVPAEIKVTFEPIEKLEPSASLVSSWQLVSTEDTFCGAGHTIYQKWICLWDRQIPAHFPREVPRAGYRIMAKSESFQRMSDRHYFLTREITERK